MELRVPLGLSSFRKLKMRNAYYIDKTPFYKEILDSISNGATDTLLFTRPRRFGKILLLSSLEAFLSPNNEDPSDLSNHYELFKGTKILEDQKFCEEYMGKFPTILISLKDTESKIDTYEDACFQVAVKVQQAAEKLTRLFNSFELNPTELRHLKEVTELSEDNFSCSTFPYALGNLCYIINKYTKIMPIVLIDEYDVPLAKCYKKEYYEKFREFYSALLSNALKDCDYVTMGIITGCLRITKESIFTGFNNFAVSSLSTSDLPELCGFTESEVDQLLDYYHLSEKKNIFKEWYDGYRIGDKEIYCPWDVVNYIAACQKNYNSEPLPYWKNTASYSMLQDLYYKNASTYSPKIAALLQHKSIKQKIDEGMSFADLDNINDTSSFWTLLFSSGYLTLKSPYKTDVDSELIIPNKCVYDIFEQFENWSFSDQNNSYAKTRTTLIESLIEGKIRTAKNILEKTLMIATSYRDFGRNVNKEAYYQAFLNGMFVDYANNEIYSYTPSLETGNGVADIVITKNDEQAVIIELKCAKSVDELDKMADTGLKQIIEKKYAEGLLNKQFSISSVTCIGLSFCGKECRLACSLIKR